MTKGAANVSRETMDRVVDLSIASSTGIPGHNRGRGDAMLDVAGNRASAAIAYVSWNNSDPTDHLAGGHWMYFEGDFAAGTVSGAETRLPDVPASRRAPLLPCRPDSAAQAMTLAGNAGWVAGPPIRRSAGG